MNTRVDSKLDTGSGRPTGQRHVGMVPRVTIQAFCETPGLVKTVQESSVDRRMSKTHVKVHMGGAPAALEAYRNAPTPNLIVIESLSQRDELIQHLDELSEYCDAGTKVIVVGNVNDIILYRELIARGVSQYLVMPFDMLYFIEAVSELYTTPGAHPIGRIVGVVGGKGGVGASTIAHNLAWMISTNMDMPTVIADLDVAFGTAGLNFNQDPPQGIADALVAMDSLDSNILDRLLSRCGDKLSLLAAPATLDRLCDFSETAFDTLMETMRTTVPMVVLDIPHQWTAWSKRTICAVDEMLIVATPDLANLRNVKNLTDMIRTARPNDKMPSLVMNNVGLPKRPEISTADFARAVELDIAAVIPFDAKLFGTAANNGQMIVEVEPNNKIAESFLELSRIVSGRSEVRKAKKNILEPFLSKLTKLAS